MCPYSRLLKFSNIREDCGSNGMKIVGGEKKKCPPIPKERGVGKK
jgi:hypothetical protein